MFVVQPVRSRELQKSLADIAGCPFYENTYAFFAADLTDDIIRYMPTIATLPAGTYVLFLGYVYENNTTWAYVEVLADNSIMRGFIPASAL